MGQIKAPIAGKTQSNRCAHGASFSKAIDKIGNAELAHFNKQMLIHELIRGSLSNYYLWIASYCLLPPGRQVGDRIEHGKRLYFTA